jgi:hypothetical protein
MDTVRIVAIETHGTFDSVDYELRTRGFATTVFRPKFPTLVRSLTPDLLLNELNTRFAATRIALTNIRSGKRPIDSLYAGPVKLLYGRRDPFGRVRAPTEGS